MIRLATALFISHVACFSLNDHATITLTAVKEFMECNQDVSISESSITSMIHYNQLEDVNVVNKDVLGYSHYFNPEKPDLKICTLGVICRYNSSVRLANLEEKLTAYLQSSGDQTFTDGVLDILGSISHHLQDISSPPHVVPVNVSTFTRINDKTSNRGSSF